MAHMLLSLYHNICRYMRQSYVMIKYIKMLDKCELCIGKQERNENPHVVKINELII